MFSTYIHFPNYVENGWGHPSSQRRRSRRSIQQSSTIISCSYLQSMRKDRLRAIFGLPYEQQSTIYSPKRKQEAKFYRDLEYSSHRPYTEGYGQKEDHALILLDLSKAFDSIHHDRLLYKISAMGASLATLNWFKSYLSGRSQAVRIGSTLSDVLPITHGVPQGAIWSPLLFCIYLNDLTNAPQECCLEWYVDDS